MQQTHMIAGPPSSKFIMTREGVLDFGKQKVVNQCKGIGHTMFRYTAKLTCRPFLDAQGFLIDHLDVDLAVQSKVKKVTSCEMLAALVAKAVKDAARKHGTHLLKVQVKIQPMPVSLASMEYEEEI